MFKLLTFALLVAVASARHQSKFTLYTNAAPHGYTLFPNDMAVMKKSDFDPNRSTKIILAAMDEGTGDNKTQELVTAYLRHHRQRLNVIVVHPVYETTPGPIISREVQYVADLIKMVHNYGALLDNVHLIGEGYYADFSAIVAEKLKPLRVGRITGLDPENKLGHLDYTMGGFVDLIVTSTGEQYENATVQYYPNGGKYQYGEDRSKDSHSAAYYYFVESIAAVGSFIGYKAESWDDFKQGDYDRTSATWMGEYAPKNATGKRYLSVNPVPLYGEAAGVRYPKGSYENNHYGFDSAASEKNNEGPFSTWNKLSYISMPKIGPSGEATRPHLLRWPAGFTAESSQV